MRAGDVAEVSKPPASSLGLTPELGVLHGVAELGVMSHQAGGSRGGRDFLQQHREQSLVVSDGLETAFTLPKPCHGPVVLLAPSGLTAGRFQLFSDLLEASEVPSSALPGSLKLTV